LALRSTFSERCVARQRRALAGAALLVSGAFALCTGASGAAAPGDDAKVRALAARNESLRRELELAEGDAFYLVLDERGSMLTLMFKGAPLRETAIESAEIGEPRARHGAGDEPIDLHAIWSSGDLHPPRINVREEVVPPPVAGTPTAEPEPPAERAEQGEFLEGAAPPADATPEPVVEVEIPKTPEELYPVPVSYEIRFAEGLTVEVTRSQRPRAAAAPPSGKSAVGAPVAGDAPSAYPTPPSPSFWQRLGRAARHATLARPAGERLRLRIVVDSLDADRLFRSLPADVKLLIRRPAGA
jgi:hypothetical protein